MCKNTVLDDETINAIKGGAPHMEAIDFSDSQLIREIGRFCWLWPFFENRHCEKYASIAKLKSLAERWTEPLENNELCPLEFFTYRYYAAGTAAERLSALLTARGKSMKSGIEAGLNPESGNEEKRIALLFIVYRLRNNLFHGNKADGNMSDQLENFRYANILLRCWLKRE